MFYNIPQYTKCISCLDSKNTTATIRESFKFIKEKEDSSSKDREPIYITMGLWVQQDQSNYKNNFNGTTKTLIQGFITKVYETYAELSYTNSQGELIKTVVSYDGIIYFYHNIIAKYSQEYIARINQFPPLCKNDYDENYDLLQRLRKLQETKIGKITFVFILDGVLKVGAKDVTIVKNLIIVEGFHVVPITSISGFSQTGTCDK